MSENLEIEVEEADLFEHHRFKADPGQEVVRIDKFLLDRMADTSRSKIQVAAKKWKYSCEWFCSKAKLPRQARR